MADELSTTVKRERKPKPPAGEEVVALIDSLEVVMPDDQRAGLLQITSEEAAASYFQANLCDSMEPTKMLAQSVFSAWLFKHIPIMPLLVTQQINSMEIAKDVASDCDRMLAGGHREKPDEPMTLEQRMGILRLKLQASQAVRTCVAAGARLVPLIQPTTKPPKPRNQPPNVLLQTNLHVHGNGTNGVTVDGKKLEAIPT